VFFIFLVLFKKFNLFKSFLNKRPLAPAFTVSSGPYFFDPISIVTDRDPNY
jgi:hypothetical protein